MIIPPLPSVSAGNDVSQKLETADLDNVLPVALARLIHGSLPQVPWLGEHGTSSLSEGQLERHECVSTIENAIDYCSGKNKRPFGMLVLSISNTGILQLCFISPTRAPDAFAQIKECVYLVSI